MSNKPIYIKYKGQKGNKIERLVTNLVTSFEIYNGAEMWVLRCVCINSNAPLLLPLKGVSFPL